MEQTALPGTGFRVPVRQRGEDAPLLRHADKPRYNSQQEPQALKRGGSTATAKGNGSLSENLNVRAVRAQTEETEKEQLILDQEKTILRIASRAARRFVTKSDDEWSVALIAFSRAVDSYSLERGDFLPYAAMLIRRDLVDAFRRESRYDAELQVAPAVLEGSAEAEEDPEHVGSAIARRSMELQKERENSLREEILSANEMLLRYGFRFMDLAGSSPKQEKTRRECARAVRAMLESPAAMRETERTGQLPMKELEHKTGVSRKVLDRYRRYILMAALILSGDYPGISEYLRCIREEGRE